MSAKEQKSVEGSEAVEVAAMSEQRFSQWVRLEVLKVAEAHGRVHAKMPDMILSDAVKLEAWVKDGKLPSAPKPVG